MSKLVPVVLAAALGLAALPGRAEEWWTIHSNGDRVSGLACAGETLYSATSGGLYAWDLATGRATRISGTLLHDNWIQAVAVTAAGEPWVATNDAGLALRGPSGWERIDVEQGLPVPMARSVLVDSRGDLWAGLHEQFTGYLVRLSGGALRVWGRVDGLPSGSVRGLAEAPDGRIWIATKHGVGCFDGTAFQAFGPADGLPSESAWAVACAPGGDVWVATEAGLARRSGTGWTSYGPADGLPGPDVRAVACIEGRVWAGTTCGAAWWDGASWQLLADPAGPGPIAVQAFAAGAGGGVWIGTGGAGIYFWRDGRIERRLALDNCPPDNDSRQTAADAGGVVWMCSAAGGVGRFDGTDWTVFTDLGLDQFYHRSLILDSGGDVWVATRGGGFFRYDGLGWRTYTTVDGVCDDYGMVVAEDPAGGLWFGTQYGGVSAFDGSTWRHYGPEDGLANPCVYWICFEPPGKVWFTTDGGVSVFDGTAFTSYYEADGLAYDRTYSMDIDSAGVKWFGSCRGLARFDGTSWRRYLMTNSGLPYYRCNSVAVDGDDKVWVGTARGLGRLDPVTDTWRVYTPADGLPGWDVLRLRFDERGNLWVACRGGGIGCLHRHGPEPAPRILAAGARVAAGPAGRELVLEAVPWVYDGPRFLRRVELGAGGLPLGIFLRDDGAGGDASAGDQIHTLVLPLAGAVPPGSYRLEITAVDYYGRRSALWPDFTLAAGGPELHSPK